VWDADAQGGASFFFKTHNKNNQQYKKLLNGDITIYNVIQHTDIHHLDIISNDALFTDAVMQQTYGLNKINFLDGNSLIPILKAIEDDYDICLIDCPPGKSIFHHNIFAASSAVLVPNIPSALSLNGFYMLLEEFKLQQYTVPVVSFFNMVQIRKKLHKHFIECSNENCIQLNNYIPFYTEIESVAYCKQSIFNTLKESKSLVFYENMWTEICTTLNWPMFAINNEGKIVAMHSTHQNGFANIALSDDLFATTEPYSNMQLAQAYSY
jgi:chromosome partitioning protein